MKRIYTLEDACIGCHLCEVACITEHSQSKDPVKAFLHEPLRPISRCTVEEWDGGIVSFSTTCRHCDEPDCMRACISGAIRKFDNGVVRVDTEQCVGCWSCVMACPYGAIQRNLTKKKANKCDLCPDRKSPACVDACPNRALVFKEGSQK
ncbi:4Fe-4S dicluster domain-containing protein [Geobacter sp.]|uniref:4Fe-4S dicluster domain-containing protein n=1 Tax=Geobacter sp. TaxID=46610 RepID=UPI002623E0FF|nr:4Fe-4S dicluster domain-containing protein [Geobacter sp.]